MRSAARFIWAVALVACVGCSDSNNPAGKDGGRGDKVPVGGNASPGGKGNEAENVAPANLWAYSPKDTIGPSTPKIAQIRSARGGELVATLATTLNHSTFESAMEFGLWEAAGGAKRALWSKPRTLVERVATSPDAKWVAGTFGGGLKGRVIVVWDARTGEEKWRLIGPRKANDVTLCFTTEGEQLLCFSDNWAQRLNLKTGEQEAVEMPSGFWCVNDAGRFLYDTGRGGYQFLLVYDSVQDFLNGRAGRSFFPAGREFKDITTGCSTGAAVGGTAVEVAGDKETPVAWSLAPGARTANVVPMDRAPVNPIDRGYLLLSPAGRHLAFGKDGLWLLDISTGKSVEIRFADNSRREGFGFLPDGTFLCEFAGKLTAFSSVDGKPAGAGHAVSEKPLPEAPATAVEVTTPVFATSVLQLFPQYCRLECVAFSADGKTLVGAARQGFDPEDRRPVLAVVDMTDGPRRKRLVALPGNPGILRVAMNADATKGAAITEDKTVVLIDLATGKSGKTLGSVSIHQPIAITMSPDGKTVWVSDGQTAGEFDTAAPEKPKQSLEGGNAPTAFLPDGRVLLSLGYRWKLAGSDGKTLVDGIEAWSADGKLFAVRDDKTIRVFDAAGEFRHTVTTKAEPEGLALSNTRVCVREGKLVRVYDLATGKLTGTLRPANADALAFSPDGRTLAVAGSHSISFWKFP